MSEDHTLYSFRGRSPKMTAKAWGKGYWYQIAGAQNKYSEQCIFTLEYFTIRNEDTVQLKRET